MNKLFFKEWKRRLSNAWRCLAGKSPAFNKLSFGLSVNRCSECEKKPPTVVLLKCKHCVNLAHLKRIQALLASQIATGVILIPDGVEFLTTIPKDSKIEILKNEGEGEVEDEKPY